jgi:hypothetical protein
MCIFAFTSITKQSFADDADVLPKGVFRANIETKLWWPIRERYDPDGNKEKLAHDYNTALDSSVFPELGDLEAAFGMPQGSATIGSSVVSFEYKYTDIISTLMYGVTDRLTVGVAVPYYWQKNNVDALLNTSNATIWENPLYGTPDDPFGVPFIPKDISESLGGTPLTTEDVQQILIQQYGYRRFETWSGNGLGDIEVGGRYQYLKTDNWRLAFTGGLRLPTGELDDPDNLADLSFGDGAYAILFRLNNDYIGIKNLVLNVTLRYDLLLPDKETLRVPDAVDRPITLNKEEVDRNLGDNFEFEVSGKYNLPKGFGISLLYNYWSRSRDRVEGKKGFAYDSLEEETDITSHIYIVGLSYSTISLFMDKKFPVPIDASISYRHRFAGSNNAVDAKYLSLALAVYF